MALRSAVHDMYGRPLGLSNDQGGDPTGYLGTTGDDVPDDRTRALLKIMAPVPAEKMVPPLPTVAGSSDARTGVSMPPDDGAVRTISQDPAPNGPKPMVRPGIAGAIASGVSSVNPDPIGSLRPGGSNPEAMPGAAGSFLGSLPGAGPSAVPALRPAGGPKLQPATGSQVQTGAGPQLQPAGGSANQPGKPGFFQTLGNILVPGAMDEIPDSQRYKQRQDAIQQERTKNAANIADVQQQTEFRRAEAAKNDALSRANDVFMMSPQQAQALGHPELAGQPITQRVFGQLTGAQTRSEALKEVGLNHDQAKVTTTGMNNDTRRDTNAATNTSHEQMNAATNSSRETVAQARDKTQMLLGTQRANTSTANNERTNQTHLTTAGMRGAGGVNGQPGSYKVPNDVTKRAALASNVGENADEMESILRRRPDLVGKIGGSISSVDQMIGSDDADLQELGQRAHNIALASNGAHGVRNVHDTQKTEDNILRGFRNGPNGVRGALQGLRGSVQTFLDDEKNIRETGGRVRPQANASGNLPDGSIQVKLANGRTGHIPAKNLDQFLKDNQGAAVVK